MFEIGWAKCRISRTSVTDVLWAYNTENTAAESLGSSPKSLEVVPRPCPGPGALTAGGGSLVWHIAAAVLVAAGQLQAEDWPGSSEGSSLRR